MKSAFFICVFQIFVVPLRLILIEIAIIKCKNDC